MLTDHVNIKFCLQVVTLLAKFLASDVIESVKGKEVHQFEDGARLYRFVRRPGPLNFLEDQEEGEEEKREDGGTAVSDAGVTGGTCFANACAFSGESGCSWRQQ